MDKPAWLKAEQLFYQAIELPPSQRDAFVAQTCNSDKAVGQLLLRLLAQQGHTQHLEQILSAEAAHLVQLEQDLSGTALGPYRLRHLLGRGGMGAVYLAERVDQQFEKQVAIKLIGTTLLQPELLHAFRTERQILANLEHGAISRLLDGGTTEQGMPYLVMEYVQGKPIDQYCQEQQLSVTALLQLFVKVCVAVAYAHQNMVVHCDLKPSNILITSSGEPKLLDFGIARLLGRAGSVLPATPDEPQRLTLQYASPELKRAGTISALSDVYSLAVVLQQLLGQQQIPDMRWILKQALQLDPSARYSSVSAFADDIKRYLGRHPVQARPDSWRYRAQMFVKRNRASSLLSALSLLAIFAFSLAIALQSRQLEQQRDQARLQRDKAQAITGFVTGMLASVDPAVAQGVQPTVRDMLDRASAELKPDSGHALSLQPETAAAVQQIIGQTYHSLGLLDLAQLHLEQAKQLVLQQGLHHTELNWQISGSLIATYKDQYKTDLVLRLSQQHLALAEQLFGKEHKLTLSAVNTLAGAYHTAGDLAKAQQMWLRLYQDRLRLLGAEHPDIVHSLVSLGIIHHWLGQYAKAEQYYLLCLEKATELLGSMHPDRLNCMSTLGSLYETNSQYAKAEPIIRQHITLARQVLGMTHPDTLRSMHNLADTYRGLGRFSEAETLFRQVLMQRTEVLGSNNIETLQSQMKLARLLMLQQKFTSAESLLADAYSKQQVQLGVAHPSALSAGQLLADTYLEQRKHQPALVLYQHILQQRRATLGAHPDSVDLLAGLAQLYLQMQNTGQAQQLLQQAELLAQQFPDHNRNRLQQVSLALVRQ